MSRCPGVFRGREGGVACDAAMEIPLESPQVVPACGDKVWARALVFSSFLTISPAEMLRCSGRVCRCRYFECVRNNRVFTGINNAPLHLSSTPRRRPHRPRAHTGGMSGAIGL